MGISSASTRLLQAELLGATRMQQSHAVRAAGSAATAAAHLALPAPVLEKNCQDDALLEAGSLRGLHGFVCDALRPQVRAMQLQLANRAAQGVEEQGDEVRLDAVIMDEAGCCPDYALPSLLMLHAPNLVCTLALGRSSCCVGQPARIGLSLKITAVVASSPGLWCIIAAYDITACDAMARGAAAEKTHNDFGSFCILCTR